MTTVADDRARALTRASADAAALAGAGGPACVTVRCHRRAAAAATRTGSGPVDLRRITDHTRQNTTAFALVPGADGGPYGVRHAAVDGYGTDAVREVVSRAVDGDRLGAPAGPDLPLAVPPAGERDAADLVEAILRRLPGVAGYEVIAEAHTVVEERLFVPARGLAVRETLRTAAVVVDVLGAGRRIADADAGWSGEVPEGLDSLAERVEAAVRRAGARPRTVAPRVQLLLVDGSAGAFLHEVCGHLLESTGHRPSLLAQDGGRPVAFDGLGVDDDPTRALSFGAHRYTMLGEPTRRRPLLTAGRLTGLLADTPDGPWRTEDARYAPQPRMSHLALAPAPAPTALDTALGETTAPVIRVHRLGFGSLDHRDGTVVLEVKDATYRDGTAEHRLEPFVVTAEARQLLLEVRALGCAATVRPWSAYCLATSGSLPVGATTPTLLTGVVTTHPHRRLAPPRAAVARTAPGPGA
ncbi:metallopeptidase TldD-related protein [Streptomyces sp. NPDC001536]|uniref:metallopeptidase TldD-related protein n=1 Tax=Streptomyces sp. NPDC001536 TaxID=3364583 RepID=UPI0036935404